MPLTLMELKRYSFIVVLLAVASCQTHDKLQRLQGDALGTSYTLLYLDTAPNEIVSDSYRCCFLAYESIHVDLLAKRHHF
jgi:hypothetical protein